MEKTFYSNGKLLLTGEYVVLDGATALAIPTKYGQYLEISASEKKGIRLAVFEEYLPSIGEMACKALVYMVQNLKFTFAIVT